MFMIRCLRNTFKNRPKYSKNVHSLKRVSHPEFDIEYLCNKKNVNRITENIKRRKGVGDILKVHELYAKLQEAHQKRFPGIGKLEEEFKNAAHKIPNSTHPSVISYGDEPKVVRLISEKRRFEYEPLEFSRIGKELNLLRTEHLGSFTGHKSYYLFGALAELEQALVQYTMRELTKRGFTFVSVPDILPSHIINKCGLDTHGDRTQVYTLDSRHGPDQCLSGTSEMALGAYLMNSIIPEEKLPLKLAAVSRCYRAEISNVNEERGIYRVHQFTKVEMFGVTVPKEADAFLEGLRVLEEDLFAALGLHLRTLDMPPHELGAPAYRKYDIEAWLPGRQVYGEVSSCSNCTDYQSRRLNIKYKSTNGSPSHVYTLNGTACAVPRMLIALIETWQQENGTIRIPPKLVPFMNNREYISKQKCVPHLKLAK